MAETSFPVRSCEIEGNKQVHFVDINGVLDIHTTRHFEDVINKLINDNVRWIIINLKRCSYISSAGLGALMSGAKQLRGREGDLYLENLSKKIMTVVELVGFNKILKIYKKENEALQAIAES